MTKTEKFLSKPSNIDELIEGLDVDDMDVIGAARSQAGLYVKAVRYRVQKMRRRIEAESTLDTVKTDLALRIREKERQQAGVKRKPMTETHIKELLLRNPRYREALDDYNEALVEEEFGRKLTDAFDHRGKAIRVVADLIGHEVALEKKMGEYQELANLKKEIRNSTKYKDEDED